MMFHTLEKLRARPRRERQMVALFAAGGITGVIFLVWVVAFLASTTHTNTSTEQAVGEASSFDTLMNSLQETTRTIGEEVRSVRESINILGGADADLSGSDNILVDTEDEIVATQPKVEVTDSGVEIIEVR